VTVAVSAYSSSYRRKLEGLKAGPPLPCAHCKRRRATTLDHSPPLAMHLHRPDSGCCVLVPSCEPCNRRGGQMVANGTWRPAVALAAPEPEPERDGFGVGHRAWRVPWLRALRDVPPDATWPRLMTIPHPRAAGSLGEEFIAYAETRDGRPLRWWQRLVAVRLLEVDADERLVWETALMTTARQVGKSWLLRELCLWRLHQRERFGEPQDILHTGKDLAVCKEVQRPARIWAKARTADYRVREVNGQEEIERLQDGSRWMLRAKEAVYGYSVALGVVDEAWRVRASSVDEGLTPTMAEREQPQLVLVSTAHRRATALVLDRRQVAIANLEVGDGDLLIEWSARPDAVPEDVGAWRMASPHWTPRRERLISKAHEKMLAGELDDPDEPDPVESFRAQWLNQWPQRRAEPGGPTEPLLPDGLWPSLAQESPVGAGGMWVAVEDDYGLGAAVGCARRTEDGRVELDAWLLGDWDSAIADVQRLAEAGTVRRLLVGASLMDRVPPGLRTIAEPRTGTATRAGLALLRDMAIGGQVVHDVDTADLDRALADAMVREAPTGLFLLSRGPTHVVRAAVWALAGAHRPAAVPAVY
jgi:hypothetical protein